MDLARVTNGSEHFTPLACRYTRPLNVRLPFVKAGLFIDQNREMLPI